ncbi:MAG: NAD(P)-dependent oxidoreductase [Pseudomonadota bacterium]
MTDCVIVQPIARCGVDLLHRAGLAVFEAPAPELSVLLPHLRTARAVITRNQGLSSEAIAAAPRLEIIAAHGTGTDRIAKSDAEARGIRVLNTPGTNARAVAEHALALIFACSRYVVAADQAVRRADWGFRDGALPREVSGRRLGLVGYGHVARALAGLALGLGMSVAAFTRHTTPAALRQDGVAHAPSLDALLEDSDIVSLHGTPGGAPVLAAPALARMKHGAILINTARGALLDEAALASALRSGHLSGAALDVFAQEPLAPDSPLLAAPNLVLTPHIGGRGVEASDRTARAVAALVIEALGLPLPAPAERVT